MPFEVGDQVRLAYRLEENVFKGKSSLQLIVSYAELAT